MFGEFLGSGANITKGLWHLNGNANDSSGNNNNGLSTNITYSYNDGKFERGGRFNGSNSYITVPHISGLTGPLTISCWVKFMSNKEAGLVSKGLHANGDFQWSINTGSVNSNNEINFNLDTTGGWGPEYACHSNVKPLTNGKWYSIIATHNLNNLSIYIDGHLKRTIACSVNSIDGDGDIYIGAFYDTTSYSHYGSIDEVIIENYAWTAEQIKKYYTYGKGLFGL